MPRRRRLPNPRWPQLDRAALRAALAKRDRFRRGPAADWANSTKQGIEHATGYWLSYLDLCDPAALAEHPLARLSKDRITGYIEHLAETVGPAGRYIYLEHLQRGVRVMFPGRSSEVLNAAVAQLRHEYEPKPKPWVTTPCLIATGQKMIAQAVRKDGQPKRIQFRDGLMFVLWPPRPVRLRAFAGMRIGKHLRKFGDEWRMLFEGSEMKSGRPFQMTVPREAVPHLEQYLCEVRHMFPRSGEVDALWISRDGGALAPNSISRLIGDHTEEALGCRITPHGFRRSAASTVAVFAPGKIHVAPALLDHTTLRMTARHYIMARGIEASREYAKVIDQLMPKGVKGRRIGARGHSKRS